MGFPRDTPLTSCESHRPSLISPAVNNNAASSENLVYIQANDRSFRSGVSERSSDIRTSVQKLRAGIDASIVSELTSKKMFF